MRFIATWLRLLPALLICLLLAAPVFAQPDPLEFETQIDYLKSDNDQFRYAAVKKLIQMRDPRAIEPLIEMINDPSPGVFSAVTSNPGMGAFPHDQVIAVILKKVAEIEGKPNVRYRQIMGQVADDIRPLLHAMASPNPRIRAFVVQFLNDKKFTADVRARKAYIAALDDPAGIVRVATARNMISTKDKELVRAEEVLHIVCKDKDAQTRADAYQALFVFCPPAADAVLAAFKDESPLVRKVSVAHLDQLDDQRAAEALIVAVNDIDASVRTAAFRHLYGLKNARRICELALPALKDPSPAVRSAAVRAIHYSGEAKKWQTELEHLLKNDDLIVKWAAAKALASCKNPALIEQYIAMLDDPELLRPALSALASLRDPRALPALVALHKKDGMRNFSFIMDTFRHLGPPANDALLQLIDDREAGFTAVFDLLLYNGDTRAIAKLEELAKDDNKDLRESALFKMAKLLDVRHQTMLLDELAHPVARDHVIIAIVDYCSVLQTPEIANTLMAQLSLVKPGDKLTEMDMWKDNYKLSALVKMEDQGARDFILDLITKDDLRLASISVGRMLEIGHRGILHDPRIIPFLLKAMAANAAPADGEAKKPSHFMQVIALKGWEYLAGISDSTAKDKLLTALRDPNPRVRNIAAIALSRFDKDAATPMLLPLLTDKDLDIRLHAAETLASFGDARAVPVLSSLLQGEKAPETRVRIIKALANCGAPAIPVLQKALKLEPLDPNCLYVELSPKGTNTDPLDRYEMINGTRPKSLSANTIKSGMTPANSPNEAEKIIISTIAGMRDQNSTAFLLALTKDCVPGRAAFALEQLVANKYPQQFDALVAGLQHPFRAVCMTSARLLGELGDPRAIEPLRKAMVRKTCASTILHARMRLNDPQAKDSPLIGELLAKFAQLRRDRELKVMPWENDLQDVLSWQALTTGRAMPSAQEFSPGYQKIIEDLGEIGDARALEPLLEGLRFELSRIPLGDWPVYTRQRNTFVDPFVTALGKLGDKRAVQPIIKALADYVCDPAIAAEALAKIDDGHAVPTILRIAAWDMTGLGDPGKDQSGEIESITRSLAAFRDEASADALKTALKSDNWRNRALAAAALGYRGEQWAVVELQPLLNDKQPQVREAVEKALGVLKSVTNAEAK